MNMHACNGDYKIWICWCMCVPSRQTDAHTHSRGMPEEACLCNWCTQSVLMSFLFCHALPNTWWIITPLSHFLFLSLFSALSFFFLLSAAKSVSLFLPTVSPPLCLFISLCPPPAGLACLSSASFFCVDDSTPLPVVSLITDMWM